MVKQKKGKSLTEILSEHLEKGRSGDVASNVKCRLESGEGFGQAFKGSVKDKFTAKGFGLDNLGKKAYLATFSGKDMFSSYMRGRLKKEDKPESISPATSSPSGMLSPVGSKDDESSTYLKIIAKNSTSLHLMSRDMNVLRQNIIKMVKSENDKKGDKKGKKPKYDATNKADTFFMREDEREAKLESERSKFGKGKKDTAPTQEKPKDDCGEICSTVMSSITKMLTSGLTQGLKALFNPKVIIKVLSKVFIIATILFSLFEGIMAGWEKWKETGDLGEAIKEGLAAIIDFLTLGLFGKDNIKKMFDSVTDFFQPIIDSIKDIYYSVKDWIANNIGVPEISIPIPSWMQKLGAPEKISIGPYYPFKDDPKSSAEQVSQREEKPKGETAYDSGGESGKASSMRSSKSIGGELTVNEGSQGDVVNNFSNLQRASQELKDLKVQYMREKVSILGSPDFEQQNQALIQKYTPLLESKKKEVDSYASLPGVKEMAKQQGMSLTDSGTLIENEKSPSVSPSSSSKSYSAPSAAPSMGGESSSPTQSSGGGNQEPTASGIVSAAAGGESMSSSGGEGGSAPSMTGTTAQSPATAATASAASDVSSPSEDTTPKPMTDTGVSGSELSSASSDVAEAQRMESSADMGSTINAPTISNSKSSSSEGQAPIASAYDRVFLDFYATT